MLTEPEGNNANETLGKVLRLDPGNEKALGGLRAIARQFEKHARQAKDQGRLNDALKEINKGLKVQPNDPTLLQLRTDITQQLEPITSNTTDGPTLPVAWLLYFAITASAGLMLMLVYKKAQRGIDLHILRANGFPDIGYADTHTMNSSTGDHALSDPDSQENAVQPKEKSSSSTPDPTVYQHPPSTGTIACKRTPRH